MQSMLCLIFALSLECFGAAEGERPRQLPRQCARLGNDRYAAAGSSCQQQAKRSANGLCVTLHSLFRLRPGPVDRRGGGKCRDVAVRGNG
jgi:hypothetical protein